MPSSFSMRMFAKGSYEASQSVPLRERIAKAWATVSLGRRQLMLFILAESVVLLLFFVQFVVFAPVLDEILLSRSESELNLLEMTYEEKVHFMGVDASLVGELHAIEDFLAEPRPGEDLYYGVQELLEEMVEELHVEYASLVDLHVPATGAGASIRVSANGNRTGEVLEAAGLLSAFTCCSAEPTLTSGMGLLTTAEFESEDPVVWRERLSEFNPVAADHMMDLEIEGLIRWVLQPVFVGGGGYDVNGVHQDMCTDDLAGVLVLGDLVNGKVPIVEETLERFDGGYSAVWYADSGAEMHQAISYMAFEQGTYAAKLAGVELEAKDFVDEVNHADEHHVSHVRESIIGNEYTMAGTRVDDVILIRGTDHELRDEKENTMRDFALYLGAAVFVTDCIVLYMTMRSFVAPLEKLGRKLQFQGSSNKSITQADLDKMPKQSEFYRRSAASQLTVIAALVTIVLLTDQVLFELQASMVSSELEVMTYFYNTKIKDLSFVANRLAEEDEYKALAADWGEVVTTSGACPDFNQSLVEIKHSLRDHAKDYNAELTFFLDTHKRVVVSGNGADPDDDTYMRCDTFDPEGIVSAVLDSPKEIRRTGTILSSSYRFIFTDLDAEDYYEAYGETESELHPEITVDDLLIRWVAVPVFTAANSAAAEEDCEAESVTDGVILLGEVLNGKLGLPGNVVDVFGDGYAGIYLYDEAIEDYVLVTSLLVSHGVVEADVAVDLALIDAAHESPTYEASDDALSIAGYTIPARTYSTKVSPVPLAVWIDAFGEREVDDEAIGFLVRGTSVEASDAVDNARQVLIIVTACGLALAIVLRLVLAYQSFLPAKKLIAAMKRAGIIKTSKSGTTRSLATSSLLSSTHFSDMGIPGDGADLQNWQYRLYVLRYRLRRLDWENWVILVLLVSSVGALSVVVPLATHLDTSAQADVIDFVDLLHDSAEYMANTRRERFVTGEMVNHGWTLDDEGEQQYDSHYWEEVEQARHDTDEFSSELLHTLTVVSSRALTDTLVADVKRVRKDVYSLREWRINVDAFLYDTAAETDLYITEMHDKILSLCETAVRLPEHADTAQLAFALVNTMDTEEAVALEDDYLTSALYHGEFETVDEFNHFLIGFEDRLVSEQNTHALVLGTEYGHWFEDTTHDVAFDLTEAWAYEASFYPEAVDFTTEEHWHGNASVVEEALYHLTDRYIDEIGELASHVLHDTEAERDLVVNETISALALNVLLLVAIGLMSKKDVAKAWLRKFQHLSAAKARRGSGGKKMSFGRTAVSVVPEHSAVESQRSDGKGGKSARSGKSSGRRMRVAKSGTHRWTMKRLMKKLRRWRGKAVGVGVFVVMGAFLCLSFVVWTRAVVEYTDEAARIDTLREIVDLAVQGKLTVRQAQLERTAAAELVGASYDDETLADLLTLQRASTDSALDRMAGLLRARPSINADVDASGDEVLSYITDEFAAWREEVDAQAFATGDDTAQFVSHGNDVLGHFCLSLGQASLDAEQVRLFVGFSSVLLSEEAVDLERTLMEHHLHYGYFEAQSDYAKVAKKILEHRRHMDTFAATLPDMVALVDELTAGTEADNLYAWEDTILLYPDADTFAAELPTLEAWLGNTTVVAEQQLLVENAVADALLADVDRVADEALETFVNVAVPHFWASFSGIVVLIVFYVRQYPLGAVVFAVTNGRFGSRLAHAGVIQQQQEQQAKQAANTYAKNQPPVPPSGPPPLPPS